MAYRIPRVANAVREVVSEAIAQHLSDPRISRFTSVTRVEVSADLQNANVYVSVMGSEGDASTTMKGLESARGVVQSMVAKRLDIRQCPRIKFHLDEGLKIARETLQKLKEVLPEVADSQAGDQSDAGLESPEDEEIDQQRGAHE